jgi:phosphonopyruvate decarboxylase
VKAVEFAAVLIDSLDQPTCYGVPCSVLGPVLDSLEQAAPGQYVSLSNEGEAVAAAFGAAIAGRNSIVYLQNSGLGNAVNPLTSLTLPAAVSLTLLIGYRGAPGSVDEPQHMLMGSVTKVLLREMGVAVFEVDSHVDVPHLREWLSSTSGSCRALLVHPGSIERADKVRKAPVYDGPGRAHAIEAISRSLPQSTSIVASTGMIGRELSHLVPRLRNFYMVGSMGCAASISMGLARAAGGHHVVLDGDGALVMRLESMVGLAGVRGARIDHIVLDNGLHETTGGQPSSSQGVDLCGMAVSAGYDSGGTYSLEEITEKMRSSSADGVRLYRLAVGLSDGERAPRPELDPAANLRSMRNSYATEVGQ